MEKGLYTAKSKSKDLLRAIMNQTEFAFPESTMLFDGKWCFFYKNGQRVGHCNPKFAEKNLILIKI